MDNRPKRAIARYEPKTARRCRKDLCLAYIGDGGQQSTSLIIPGVEKNAAAKIAIGCITRDP
jgi:hypothetical protein